MDATQETSKPSSDYDMSLIPRHKYRMMLMWQEVIEGTITAEHEDWFYIKIGKRIRQFYYWDVDYAEDITNE